MIRRTGSFGLALALSLVLLALSACGLEGGAPGREIGTTAETATAEAAGGSAERVLDESRSDPVPSGDMIDEGATASYPATCPDGTATTVSLRVDDIVVQPDGGFVDVTTNPDGEASQYMVPHGFPGYVDGLYCGGRMIIGYPRVRALVFTDESRGLELYFQPVPQLEPAE
jgi:hypothetical protein